MKRLLDEVSNAGRRLMAPLAGFPGLSLNGTTVAQNLNDADLQAKTIVELHRKVDLDIVFPMMDLTVESEAFGANIDWETDEMPTIKGVLVETLDEANALRIPEIGKGNRLNVYVDTCRKLHEALPEKRVWGYVLGPFSIAGRLMAMTEIAIAVKLEPEVVHGVLAKTNALLEKYINALLDTGIDGVMILEPAASLLRESDATEFSNIYIKHLVEIMKSRVATPSLHNCGQIDHLIESLCATGIEALHIGSVADPFAIYPRIPENVVLMGNLDPTEIFLRSTPDGVSAAASALCDKMVDFPRYILSSGCDLPPGTLVENVKALESVIKSAVLA